MILGNAILISKERLWQERKRAVKKAAQQFSREKTQTSTVKSAERVDRGQEAIKRVCTQSGDARICGRISKRDELAGLEKTAPYGRCNGTPLNLTLSEKDYQTCTKTMYERFETENGVEWTVYEISFSKNLNLEDIKSTLSIK